MIGCRKGVKYLLWLDGRNSMKRKWTGILPLLTALCIGIQFPVQAADRSLPGSNGYMESEHIEITGNAICYDFPDSSEEDVNELNELLNQMEFSSLRSYDEKFYLVKTKKDGETSFRFGLSSGKLSFEEAEDSEKSHHFQIDLLASSEDFENVKTSWMEAHPDYVIRELAQCTFRNKEMYGYLVLYHAKEENSSTEKETEEPETERITEDGTEKPTEDMLEGSTEKPAEDGTEKPFEITQEVVRMVQESLNDQGYDCGRPDGLIGPQTGRAIRKFREDHNLSSSSEIDQELLDALGIGSV